MDNLLTITVEEHFVTQAILDRTATLTGPMDSAAARAQVPLLLDLGEQRIAAMDASGIDMQVVSHTAPGLEWVDASDAEPLAREANDILLQAIASAPDRLSGLAALPVTDPPAVAEELRRAIGLGLRGGLVNGTANGRFLDAPEYRDLLACAAELSVPLYIHPGIPPAAVRDAYYGGFSPEASAALATAAWGWHAETAVHVLRLMLAGVFDEHPDLEIIIGHMGEMLPIMAARAEMVFAAARATTRPLREYFADHVYVSTAGVFDPHAFAATVALVGIDRVMLSVDYPYIPAAPAMAFLQGLDLEDSARSAFAGTNAARVFGLGSLVRV